MGALLIVLLALPLVAWAVTRRLAWALPTAVMLYIGAAYLWPIPVWATILFWVIVALAVVALIVAVRDLFPIAVVAVLLMALIAGLFGLADSGNTDKSVAKKPAVVQGTGTPAPGKCPAQFVQKFDPNRGGNFASNGVKNDADVMKLAAKDARYLAFFANKIGLDKDSNPNPLLVPGNACLSFEGQALYNQVYGALHGKGTNVNEHGNAPGNYVNTAMVGNRGTVSSTAGISGNRAAVVYRLRNGTKVYVMKRCANLALPPGLPPPPRHSTPPSPTPTPTPTTTCKYGVTKTGLCKKSPNPKDYVYPSGKPKASVSGPAEKSPPPVATQSNPAATPTITAPGASPSPSQYTPPPPPVTGAPSPSDPGTSAPCAPGIPSC